MCTNHGQCHMHKDVSNGYLQRQCRYLSRRCLQQLRTNLRPRSRQPRNLASKHVPFVYVSVEQDGPGLIGAHCLCPTVRQHHLLDIRNTNVVVCVDDHIIDDVPDVDMIHKHSPVDGDGMSPQRSSLKIEDERHVMERWMFDTDDHPPYGPGINTSDEEARELIDDYHEKYVPMSSGINRLY
jgi:hypothetical protein